MLSGEPDDDGGEDASGGEGPRVEAGDPEGDGDHRQRCQQPHQEADGPGGAGIEAPVQGGPEAASGRPREREAEDQERSDGGDPDLGLEAGKQLRLPGEEHQHPRGEGAEEQHTPQGAVCLMAIDLGAEPGLPPDLGARLEGRAPSPERKSPHLRKDARSSRFCSVRGSQIRARLPLD